MRIYLYILAVIILSSCGSSTDKTDSTTLSKDTVVITEKELVELNDNITKEPSNPTLYHRRAKYYISIRDYNAALIDMSQVMNLDSTRVEYLLTLADLYSFANRTSYSKRYLEKIIKMDPKNTETMLKLSELYMLVKKNQESINYANMALKIDEHLSKAYFLKGMNYLDGHDTLKAISSFITATEQDPEYYSAYMLLGTLNAQKKSITAIGYYDQALRIDPKSTEAYYNKGKFYQDVKQYDKAIETYNTLLSIDSTYTAALYNIGAINYVNEKYMDAVRFFSKTICFNPQHVEAFYARGLSYKYLNDKSKAVADFKMAVQLKPDYGAARDALSEVRK